MKYLKCLILSLAVFFIGTFTVNAASLGVNEYLSSSQIVVGNKVTVTVKLSSSEPIGVVNYSVTYDSSKLQHVSGTLNHIFTAENNSTKEKSLVFTFKAIAAGDANINFRINEAIAFNEQNYTYSNQSKTVKIITNQQLQATYSKDNNLSNLGVTGFQLAPGFSKDNINYSLEVENEIDKITVTGSKSDSKASVSGLGEHTLEEGQNKIEVKVTAQNGSSKVYTINVTRKELTPIVVTIGDTEYNVVRKEELLTAPNSTFEKSTIQISELDVPTLLNKAIDTTLVGLKDKDGNVTLYTYKDNKYEKYKEIDNSNTTVIPTNNEIELPSSYKKEDFSIGEEKYTGYTKDSIFYILKGINLETGEEKTYQYDTKEKTLQIYNDSDARELTNQIATTAKRINKRNILIIVLAGLLVVTYIGILISIIKNSKKKNKKEKKEKTKKEIIDDYDDIPLKSVDEYKEEVKEEEFNTEIEPETESEVEMENEDKEEEEEIDTESEVEMEDDDEEELEEMARELGIRKRRSNKRTTKKKE